MSEILIVEDDQNLGQALFESFKRSNISAYWVKTPDEARNIFKVRDFFMVICDCLLPGTNGVDLASELTEISGGQLSTILISGIFKDKQFIKQAGRKVNLVSFQVKPFDTPELIQLVKKHLPEHKGSESENPLYSLLMKNQISEQEKLSLIESEKEFSGSDLPWIYSLLYQSNVTGKLHISYEDQQKSMIHFTQGTIDHVQTEDKNSFFGVLLVENGFLENEDIQYALKQQNNKRIGEQLVDMSMLSPHAIQVVHEQQMSIRLSQSIKDQKISLNFEEDNQQDNNNVPISKNLFFESLSDWITSKVSLEWLKTHVNRLQDHEVLEGPNYEEAHKFFNLPIFFQFPHPGNLLQTNKSVNEILVEFQDNEDAAVRALFFMLFQRCIILSYEHTDIINFEAKKNKLEKIQADFENKNYFEILGLRKNTNDKDVARAYHEFAKSFHPDKLAKNTPEDIKELTEKIFQKITHAYTTLKTEESRKDYKVSLDLQEAQKLIVAESEFEKYKKILLKRQYKEAYDGLVKLERLKKTHPTYSLYLAWATMKKGRAGSTKKELLNTSHSIISEIPPEQRHNATYFHVKGLYYKLAGNVEKASNSFQKSLSLEPSFISPKVELSRLQQQNSKQHTSTQINTILNFDIGSIFKKKKSS